MAAVVAFAQEVARVLAASTTLADAHAALARAHPDLNDAEITEWINIGIGGTMFDRAVPPESGSLREKFWAELVG